MYCRYSDVITLDLSNKNRDVTKILSCYEKSYLYIRQIKSGKECQ